MNAYTYVAQLYAYYKRDFVTRVMMSLSKSTHYVNPVGSILRYECENISSQTSFSYTMVKYECQWRSRGGGGGVGGGVGWPTWYSLTTAWAPLSYSTTLAWKALEVYYELLLPWNLLETVDRRSLASFRTHTPCALLLYSLPISSVHNRFKHRPLRVRYITLRAHATCSSWMIVSTRDDQYPLPRLSDSGEWLLHCVLYSLLCEPLLMFVFATTTPRVSHFSAWFGIVWCYTPAAAWRCNNI